MCPDSMVQGYRMDPCRLHPVSPPLLVQIEILYNKTVIIITVLSWTLWVIITNLWTRGGCGTPQTCSQLVWVLLYLQLASDVGLHSFRDCALKPVDLPLPQDVGIRTKLHCRVAGRGVREGLEALNQLLNKLGPICQNDCLLRRGRDLIIIPV